VEKERAVPMVPVVVKLPVAGSKCACLCLCSTWLTPVAPRPLFGLTRWFYIYFQWFTPNQTL
jgi:hypothetical protein